MFKSFHKEILNQFGSIKVLHSIMPSNTCNLRSKNTVFFGIIYQTNCAHTPQRHGVAERKNHHLLVITPTIMIYVHAPKHFWVMHY